MTALTHFAGTERYEPIRLLGMGGMGAVFEVHDLQTHCRLELKLSSDNTSPYHWFLCLRSASRLRALTSSEQSELEAITQREGFVEPS